MHVLPDSVYIFKSLGYELYTSSLIMSYELWNWIIITNWYFDSFVSIYTNTPFLQSSSSRQPIIF